jgi:type I restriction enzyme M protein
MRGIAPTEKDSATDTLEKRLWAAADPLRANSGVETWAHCDPIPGFPIVARGH